MKLVGMQYVLFPSLSQSPITPSVSLSTAPSSAVPQFSNPFIPHSNILKHPRFVGAIDRTFHHFFSRFYSTDLSLQVDVFVWFIPDSDEGPGVKLK